MSSSPYHQYDMQPNLQPAPKWWIGYVAGSLLLIVGIILPCVGTGAMVVAAAPGMGGGTVIASTGKSPFSVDKPRRMVVWLEDSESSGNPPVPPDLKITITGAAGQTVLTRAPGTDLENDSSETHRSPVVVFTPSNVGPHAAEVTGKLASSQTLIIAEDDSMKMAGFGLGVMAVGLIGLIMIIGGITTLVVTIVKHTKYRREAFTPV